MKIPQNYCTEKRTLLEFQKAWKKEKLAGNITAAAVIATKWQTAAKQYQAVHRMQDIFKGAIQYNPLLHRDPLFTMPENQPMSKRGDL